MDRSDNKKLANYWIIKAKSEEEIAEILFYG